MTDAERAIREALADPALFDPGASTADTYSACKAFGTACTPENMRALLAERDALKADAERYRWLRENAVSYSGRDHALELVVPHRFADKWREETDAAIDAAKGQA